MLKFQYVLKTVKQHVENFRMSENCNACCVFKISAHVENCNACSKLCWIFQGMLKTCWKFQGMLKTIICVENYVETACWKFQHVLRTVTHVESHVKISRCVENVYIRHVENHIENHVEVRKKHNHTFTARVEIEQHISFFSFGFARVSEVRHIRNGFFYDPLPPSSLTLITEVLHWELRLSKIVLCYFLMRTKGMGTSMTNKSGNLSYIL